MLALLLGTYGGLRGVRYELARVRRHHRLLLVSLPRLFFVISLSPHRHYSIGRTIVSSTASIHPHPQPLFTLSLLVVSSLSKLLSIPHANSFSYFLFRFPPSLLLPLSPLSSRSAPSSLPLSLSVRQSLSISISPLGSKVFQDGQHPYSSSQNITKHKYKSYSLFAV